VYQIICTTLRVQTPQNQKLTERLKKDQAGLEKPVWLKIRPPTTEKYAGIATLLRAKKLTTVCAEAHCPNIAECWSGGTATFMVLGEVCTRACRFCYVKSGNPRGMLDETEPRRLVEAATVMKLEYVVLTCVTRDDLADGGAGHFARCIRALKVAHPKLLVEVLISDLNGNLESLKTIIEAGPDVIAHNLETVERLQGEVRDPRAGYGKSLGILEGVKGIVAGPAGGGEQSFPKLRPAGGFDGAAAGKKIFTKSSLMLGLGETEEEVVRTMKDLRAIGVDVVTFGQYLRPSEFHLAVKEYVTPEQFKKYERLARELGFLYCASGAFVRSSYKAGELFMKNILLKNGRNVS